MPTSVRLLWEPVYYILKEAFATYRRSIQNFPIPLWTWEVLGRAIRCNQQGKEQTCSRDVYVSGAPGSSESTRLTRKLNCPESRCPHPFPASSWGVWPSLRLHVGKDSFLSCKSLLGNFWPWALKWQPWLIKSLNCEPNLKQFHSDVINQWSYSCNKVCYVLRRWLFQGLVPRMTDE